MLKPIFIEAGIALITALLVVALATIAAVEMTTRQQFDIYRTANIINAEQAYVYALGGESWAKRILLRDDNNIDNVNEFTLTLPIPGGELSAHLKNLQGHFNLNNLRPDCQKQNAQISFETVFERLLQVVELSELSLKLAPVIMDWIDSDLETQFPFGAEDDVYLIQKPAYRTANTLFSNPSEMRLLADLDHTIYTKMLPYISTLPTCTLINVNIAKQEILLALFAGLSKADAIAIMATREKTPFESVTDFLAHDVLAGLTKSVDNITVTSQYFQLTTKVNIARSQIQLTSILYRSAAKVKVILRSREIY